MKVKPTIKDNHPPLSKPFVEDDIPRIFSSSDTTECVEADNRAFLTNILVSAKISA